MYSVRIQSTCLSLRSQNVCNLKQLELETAHQHHDHTHQQARERNTGHRITISWAAGLQAELPQRLTYFEQLFSGARVPRDYLRTPMSQVNREYNIIYVSPTLARRARM